MKLTSRIEQRKAIDSTPKSFFRRVGFRHIFALVMILPILAPASTSAYKLETHVWIAQQVLNDVLTDGKVTLPAPFGQYAVDPVIVESLRRFQNEYRMGTVGPDGFPDLVGGQMTTHPGLAGGWQTDDWLRHVLTAARPESGQPSARIAFAYGYLTHAASDIFAHSYVNSYSGDIFDLTKHREATLRHIALETYIKKHNPPLVATTVLKTGYTYNTNLGRPEAVVDATSIAGFLKDVFVLNADAAAQYRQVPATSYLAQMFDFWKSQNNAIEKIDMFVNDANARINGIQTQIDSVKNLKVCSFGICVKVYPAYCFLDPATCVLVLSLEATLKTYKELVDVTAASVRVPLQAWRNQVETAVEQYILTSQDMARAMMKSDIENLPVDQKPKAIISRWLCNYAPAFAAIPSEVTAPGCATQAYLSSFKNGIDQARSKIRTNLGILSWAVDPMGAISDLVDREIKPGLWSKLARELTDDGSVMVSLADMLNKNSGTAELREEFQFDNSGANLLLIPDIATRVDRDMQITSAGYFDPDRFPPVYNAIVLSKLLLLGPAELNRMVETAGIGFSIYGSTTFNAEFIPFNILLGAVRSIDGHHQWQETALPLPRAQGTESVNPDWSAERHYGEAFAHRTSTSDATGFRLWQDCEVRQKVFKSIFKGPVAPGLSELGLLRDPNWESAANPFPLSPGSRDVPKYVNARLLQGYVCGERWSKIVAQTPVYMARSVDNTAPAIAPQKPVLAECTAAAGGKSLNLIRPAVADSHDTAPVVTLEAPPEFRLGTSTITWTVTDESRNRSSLEQEVRIVDTTPPRFVEQLPTLSVIATQPAGASVNLIAPTAFDDCDGKLTAMSSVDLDILPMGRNEIIWTARDQSGNAAIVRQIVNVKMLSGDLNVDGVVDGADLLMLQQAIGTRAAGESQLRDFNNDGVINEIDQSVFRLIQDGNGDPRDLNRDGIIDAADIRRLASLIKTFAGAPNASSPNPEKRTIGQRHPPK